MSHSSFASKEKVKEKKQSQSQKVASLNTLFVSCFFFF
jgi:hypothetical protein